MLRPVRALPLAAAVIACAVVAGNAGSASTPTVYQDQDATPLAAGAPDLSTAAVTNDESSVYVVAGFAAAPPAGTFSILYLDTDRNPMTGDVDLGGVEVVIGYSPADNTFVVLTWNSTDRTLAPAPVTGFGIQTSGTSVEWVVPRSVLGTSPGFDFWLLAAVITETGPVGDDAPSQSLWTYRLQKTDTAAPVDAVTLGESKAVAGRPKAGSSWTASLEVVRSDTGVDLGNEGNVACHATVGGVALRWTHAGFATVGSGLVEHTSAVCTWKLPKSAHGKTIRAVVTTTYKGAKASHTFAAKVA